MNLYESQFIVSKQTFVFVFVCVSGGKHVNPGVLLLKGFVLAFVSSLITPISWTWILLFLCWMAVAVMTALVNIVFHKVTMLLQQRRGYENLN